MEQNVLVDSNFFISRLRKGRDPFRELAEADEGILFYSCGVVKMEVCRGVKERRLFDRMKQNFDVMCWVPSTDAIWDKANELAWASARRGNTMQLTDLVIAVSAMEVDAAVLTADSDFLRIPGLRVVTEV